MLFAWEQSDISALSAQTMQSVQEDHLGDNRIQNFHLARYIIGFMVRNFVYRDATAEP